MVEMKKPACLRQKGRTFLKISLFFVYDQLQDLPVCGVDDACDRPDDPGGVPAHGKETSGQIDRSGDRPVNAVILTDALVQTGIISFLEQFLKALLTDGCEGY